MRIKYEYNGCVLRFQDVVIRDWQAFTFAVSEKKARANFEFQAKKLLGLIPSARISLPGEIKPVA